MLVVKNKRPNAFYDGNWKNQFAFHPLLMNDLHRFLGGDEYSEVPKVNITENENEFTIDLAVPGVSKEDLKINIEKNVLTISSEIKKDSEDKKPKFLKKEFSYYRFKRSFNIPENTDTASIKANHSNGVLTVVIPKKAQTKERDIKTITIG